MESNNSILTSFNILKSEKFKCNFQHFRRAGDEWYNDYDVQKSLLECHIVTFGYLALKNVLFAWTADGHILELDQSNQSLIFRKNLTSDFKDFDLIQPLGEVYVTYSEIKILDSWYLKSGEHVSYLSICINQNLVPGH